MKPVIWLFVLFIVASGLSAWIGNDWGRRIGKRKLTVFSLRPKHTSTFLTILLSMCLSLGFLGTYLLIDKDAREVLLQPEVRQERESQVAQQQMSQFSSTLQQLQNREFSASKNAVKLAVKPNSANSDPASGKPAANTAKSAKPASDAQGPVEVAARPAAPMRLASRPLPAEDDRDWTADETEARPQRQARQPETRQLTTQNRSVTRPQQNAPVLAPRNNPSARVAEPESSAGTWQPSSAPVQVAMLSDPVFELRVYGGRSPIESEQIVEGVLDMTRAYAEQLGIEPGAGPLLQVQQANLSQSQRALEKEQIYQLQVQIGKVSDANQSLPVKLVLAPASGEAGFDPHQLLEDARLNPNGGTGSLQEDLQLAILNLAREARAELQLAPLEAPQDVQLASAELPFTVVRLRRSGATLQGQIVMSADSASLTEN